jgi:hypothetical protein
MRILIAGGTGFIGSALIRELSSRGHEIVALVRESTAVPDLFPAGVQIQRWDGRTPGEWSHSMEEVNAVINLSGASLASRRWTRKRKVVITQSRIDATRALVAAMRTATRRPEVLVNASAVGYYGPSGEGIVTEENPPGDDFLGTTCRQWESEASAAASLGVRVVLPRFGVVLAQGGGALDRMLVLFRMFLGGPLGSGKQWYPWVHRADAVGALVFLLTHPEMEGPVNAVSPDMVTMKAFAEELGRVLGRPSWLSVPSFVLRTILGEMAGMVLEGRRILPVRLLEAEYVFKYPTLRAALEATLR